MLHIPQHDDQIDRLTAKLCIADAPTPGLMAETAAVTCDPIGYVNNPRTKALRFDRLSESEAWTDLALALIERELPEWTLRRLVNADGEWLCSLSTHPNVPLELDDTADARHENLPLAILSAFVEARRRSFRAEPRVQTVPRVSSAPGDPLCCDNFA